MLQIDIKEKFLWYHASMRDSSMLQIGVISFGSTLDPYEPNNNVNLVN